MLPLGGYHGSSEKESLAHCCSLENTRFSTLPLLSLKINLIPENFSLIVPSVIPAEQKRRAKEPDTFQLFHEGTKVVFGQRKRKEHI